MSLQAIVLLLLLSMKPDPPDAHAASIARDGRSDDAQLTELAREPRAREIFRVLLHDARCARRGEQAAFIVRTPTGALVAVEWPASGSPDSASWKGPFPAGAIAIIHTHPNWLPLPSRIDVVCARRLAMPIYVITRSQIARTNGGAPEVVLNDDWSR